MCNTKKASIGSGTLSAKDIETALESICQRANRAPLGRQKMTIRGELKRLKIEHRLCNVWENFSFEGTGSDCGWWITWSWEAGGCRYGVIKKKDQTGLDTHAPV